MQKVSFTSYNSKEEQEAARVLEAAQTTYTERFYTLMKLIKISKMISGAKIILSPQINNNK